MGAYVPCCGWEDAHWASVRGLALPLHAVAGRGREERGGNVPQKQQTAPRHCLGAVCVRAWAWRRISPHGPRVDNIPDGLPVVKAPGGASSDRRDRLGCCGGVTPPRSIPTGRAGRAGPRRGQLHRACRPVPPLGGGTGGATESRADNQPGCHGVQGCCYCLFNASA